MRDITAALGFSITLALAFYFVTKPFIGPEAGQIITGAFATGPLFAEYLKGRRLRALLPIRPVDIIRESGFSWKATVTYGVLLMIGTVSVLSFCASVLQHIVLLSIGVTHPLILSLSSAVAAAPAILIVYFQLGKLFALCRRQRWAALLAVIVLGPLILRIIDFAIIPDSYFDAAFPLMDRTLPDFAGSLMWTMSIFAVPVTLGTLWYSWRVVRLRVASTMRLLPQDTQLAIAELVHDELRRGLPVSASSGQTAAGRASPP